MPDATRQRLRDMIALLRRHPEGMTAVDIANELDVSRRTAYNDIDRLSRDGIPIYEEDGQYFLDPDYETEIQLSLAEAWLLYLPLRRMVRAEQNRLPMMRSLLRQVTALLHDDMVGELTPGVDDEEDDQVRDRNFRSLVQCWYEERYVLLDYFRPNAERATQLTVAPWWFEPAVWSDASYLICGVRRGDGTHEPLTLKLDRIKTVLPLQEHFERPAAQQVTDYLEKAWGIWVGDEEPVLVKLRFHSRQHDRLLETHWHPTQTMYVDQDGSIIWHARVAEPQEMLPWIRGWGADVEVIEPVSLRRQLIQEARKLAQVYGVTETWPSHPSDVLWAKYDRTTGQTHRLIYHLIDVAQVALAMWESVLNTGIKHQIARWLGLDMSSAGRAMAFWAGLHDIGKASPVFQYKNPDVIGDLEALGLRFSTLDLEYVPHGLLSAFFLSDLLETETGLPHNVGVKSGMRIGRTPWRVAKRG